MLRPQILIVLIVLGSLGAFSLHEGMTEITTGCVTLMGALGMKILEKDN
jgi:hypothetical protein